MDPQQSVPQQAPLEPATPVVEDVRQQIVSSIQSGKNVLVTVKANPSVDELASALGLTFLLGKLDKHVTAVFSGKIPSAMEFLDPEKTFEDTVDSLRDFIIALDKDKADKLRYKVEDDVVKVFITPYKTVISEKDLSFSQGDFNVDVVIALGVTKREELDNAILTHGRILHDATVVTLNAGGNPTNLGSINWHDQAASSIAEMLVSLSEMLGGDQLDAQISTALLTGVVAETNRFSNDKTSPKVMSIAAQLMAAGANQQLIATNLRQEGMISQTIRDKKADQPHDDDGEMVLEHKSDKSDIKQDAVAEDEVTSADKTDEKSKKTTKSAKYKTDTPKPTEEASDVKDEKKEQGDAPADPEVSLKQALNKAVEEHEQTPEKEVTPAIKEGDANVAAPETSVPESSGHKIIEPLAQPEASDDTPPSVPVIEQDQPKVEAEKPLFGGTLNATTSSEEEKNNQKEPPLPTLEHDSKDDLDESLDDARKAVEEAASSQPFNPANQPLESINASALPPIEPSNSLDSTVSAAQDQATPSAAPEPTPMDAFMQPQGTPNELNDAFKMDTPSISLPLF